MGSTVSRRRRIMKKKNRPAPAHKKRPPPNRWFPHNSCIMKPPALGPYGLWQWNGKLTSPIPHNPRIIKAATLMAFLRFLSQRSNIGVWKVLAGWVQFCEVVVSSAPRIITFEINGRVFKKQLPKSRHFCCVFGGIFFPA